MTKFRILRPPNTGIEIEQWEQANTIPAEFERSGTIFWSMEEAIKPDEVLEYSNLNIPDKLRGTYDDFNLLPLVGGPPRSE